MPTGKKKSARKARQQEEEPLGSSLAPGGAAINESQDKSSDSLAKAGDPEGPEPEEGDPEEISGDQTGMLALPGDAGGEQAQAQDLAGSAARLSTASLLDGTDESFADFTSIDLREQAGQDEDGAERQKTSELPLKAQILLGPMHKYRLMGVFPWPFLVHVLLVIADSYWIVYMNQMNSAFISRQKMIWYFKFSNPDVDRDDYAYERRKTFDTVAEMQD